MKQAVGDSRRCADRAPVMLSDQAARVITIIVSGNNYCCDLAVSPTFLVTQR